MAEVVQLGKVFRVLPTKLGDKHIYDRMRNHDPSLPAPNHYSIGPFATKEEAQRVCDQINEATKKVILLARSMSSVTTCRVSKPSRRI